MIQEDIARLTWETGTGLIICQIRCMWFIAKVAVHMCCNQLVIRHEVGREMWHIWCVMVG